MLVSGSVNRVVRCGLNFWCVFTCVSCRILFSNAEDWSCGRICHWPCKHGAFACNVGWSFAGTVPKFVFPRSWFVACPWVCTLARFGFSRIMSQLLGSTGFNRVVTDFSVVCAGFLLLICSVILCDVFPGCKGPLKFDLAILEFPPSSFFIEQTPGTLTYVINNNLHHMGVDGYMIFTKSWMNHTYLKEFSVRSLVSCLDTRFVLKSLRFAFVTGAR